MSARTTDRPATAIAIMLAGVALLVGMNTAVKLIGQEFHVFQIVFLRNVVAALLLLPVVLATAGAAALRTRRPGMQLIRTLSGLSSVSCFYYAVQRLPVADVMVISQAVPLFVTALAVPLLRETVGWRRWSAVGAGFLGVLIALGPVEQVSGAALIAVAGTLLWAITFLAVRSLGATDNPSATTFYYMVLGTIAAGVLQPWFWATPTQEMLVLCLAAGVFGALGQLLLAWALRFGEASLVTPFNYSAILWGVGVDLALWSVAPSGWTLGGAAIIAAAGLYIFRREGRATARGG